MKKFIKVIAIVLVAVTVSGFLMRKTAMRIIYPDKYSDRVVAAANEYGIEPNLLFAVIHTESGFDPNAESYAGARGLTQITEDTFDWLLTKTGEDYTFDDLFNADISIKYGALFLGLLKTEFGNDRAALAAYHAGRGSVNSWLKNSEYSSDGETLDKIPISDTAHYVNKVTKAINQYENLYDY